MVDIINMDDSSFKQMINRHLTKKIYTYVQNNSKNDTLYFYYGNQYKFKDWGMSHHPCEIRKLDMDKLNNNLIIDYLSCLLPLICNHGINIIVYTEDASIKLPEPFIILPAYCIAFKPKRI